MTDDTKPTAPTTDNERYVLPATDQHKDDVDLLARTSETDPGHIAAAERVTARYRATNLSATLLQGHWVVEDSDGGVWWPSDSAQTEIDDADDPAATAVAMCAAMRWRGTWGTRGPR